MKPIEYLYLDNFRGFEKALISFRQVTFLLGENSSGKSSVLSTLNLVRNLSFWSEADFDTDNQHLGGFIDLVTEGRRRIFLQSALRGMGRFFMRNTLLKPHSSYLPRMTTLKVYLGL